jgi:hypothetical protein
VSAVDGAVRTPGRGLAALPDTGHCRSRPDGRSRTWPPLLFRTGGWVAMPGGRRSCSPPWRWSRPAAAAASRTASGPHAARVAMSTVAVARATTCPRAGGSHLVVGRTLRLGRQAAAARAWPPTSTWSRLPDTLSGHRPSGRRSFRKQRTVNPPAVPARYSFLYPSSRPALRPGSDTAATGEPASPSKPGCW